MKVVYIETMEFHAIKHATSRSLTYPVKVETAEQQYEKYQISLIYWHRSISIGKWFA
ncbi:hypothetical protein [Exiguobacterium acetylicum]|uniref:hypothetical protein n=1 Tax=Exiguobacterium acetylicum TaxID=41170 RepID=UPI001CA6AF98|nr:hypothetical protein [Exiguobacterium acetylicum]QZY88556.1 hypothetical protein K7G97_16600 [Exiguobacterium acetylicum]